MREALWQCPRSAAVSCANVHSFGANTAMLTNDGNSSALRLTMCCHCLLVADDADNLALACRNCNERRGNRSEGRDPVTGHIVPIFNPRQEKWPAHFVWDKAKIRIFGHTPIGRATIELLDLNDDRHDSAVIRIRQRDVADGYHPPPDDPVLPE